MVKIGMDSVRGYSIGSSYRAPEAGERYATDFAVGDRTANMSVWAPRKPHEKEMSA